MKTPYSYMIYVYNNLRRISPAVSNIISFHNMKPSIIHPLSYQKNKELNSHPSHSLFQSSIRWIMRWEISINFHTKVYVCIYMRNKNFHNPLCLVLGNYQATPAWPQHRPMWKAINNNDNTMAKQNWFPYSSIIAQQIDPIHT